MATISKSPKEKKDKPTDAGVGTMIAIIRVRGESGVRFDIEETMRMLHLYRAHYCSVNAKNPSLSGMLQKIKDFVTFGEVDKETIELLQKRNKSGKPFIRLNSPKGGFERKGIKKQFIIGGALGYRGAKINDLIRKMM